MAGLFVEDENLLRLAGLPILYEMGVFSATWRRIQGEELAREIRVQSRHVHRVFLGRMQRAHVTSSFRVVRGSVPREVLAAALDADMIVLGKVGWSLLQRRRLGSTVHSILPGRFGLALIVKENTRLNEPLAVVYTGSPAAERALAVANILRRRSDEKHPLIVLLLAEAPEICRALQERLARRLAEQGTAVRFRTLKDSNALQLAHALRAEGCGMVILPARSATLQNDALVELLEQLELPSLLVT